MTPMRLFQLFVIALVAVMIASASYAFAATNTVFPETAGDGVNIVSGYTVTNVAYSLNASDPSTIDSVSFTLNASAGIVKIKLTETGSTWYHCAALSGNDWTCNTPGATVILLDQLRVVASSH